MSSNGDANLSTNHICCSPRCAELPQNGALSVLKHLVQNTGFEKDFHQHDYCEQLHLRSLAIRADFRVGAVVPLFHAGIGGGQREKDGPFDSTIPKPGASMQLPRS